MKENIEYLEIEIENSRYFFEEFGDYGSLDKGTMFAIENLIKAYKELEERNHYLVQERQQYEEMLFKSKEHYIEKDKIREKINEIEIKAKANNYVYDINNMLSNYSEHLELTAKYSILKELLEE